jgi:uncharacterized protein
VTSILAVVSFGAAVITGALGYGYSSITVPIALLLVSNRVLNPALVIVEVAVNCYSALLNRRAIGAIWARVVVVVVGIVPGVALGSLLLSRLEPATVKLVVYTTLLPQILFQAAGVRIPFRRERAIGLPVGIAVGTLYALTTISGPPLALFFNNQGLTKDEFRVALAVTRVAESVLTLISYAALGLLTRQSGELALWLAPGVLLGIPLGQALIRRTGPETFRRICMSFDAWLVGFGLSRLVAELGIVPTFAAYQILATTLLIDAVLLRRFFARPAVPCRDAEVRS